MVLLVAVVVPAVVVVIQEAEVILEVTLPTITIINKVDQIDKAGAIILSAIHSVIL